MLMLPFSEYMSHEKASNSDKSAQKMFTFSLTVITFPTSQTTLFLKYPELFIFREVPQRLVLPSALLAASWINIFSATDLGVSAFASLNIRQTNLDQ